MLSCVVEHLRGSIIATLRSRVAANSNMDAQNGDEGLSLTV